MRLPILAARRHIKACALSNSCSVGQFKLTKKEKTEILGTEPDRYINGLASAMDKELTDQDIADAYSIYISDDGEERAFIEAFLISGMRKESIAKLLRLPEKTITTYEKCFFDTAYASRLHDSYKFVQQMVPSRAKELCQIGVEKGYRYLGYKLGLVTDFDPKEVLGSVMTECLYKFQELMKDDPAFRDKLEKVSFDVDQDGADEFYRLLRESSDRLKIAQGLGRLARDIAVIMRATPETQQEQYMEVLFESMDKDSFSVFNDEG